MKILILGSGGREHALAWRLSQDRRVSGIWAAPGSDAMPAVRVDLAADDHYGLTDFVKVTGIDLTVVGPEAVLYTGIVDVFRKKGLAIFGPVKAAAEIERSKIFAKEVMSSAGIPTADSKVFGDFAQALEYVEQLFGRCVVKAPGPAQGKGAFVCRNVDEARRALELILVKKSFGSEPALIEELMTGPEASFYVVTDGSHILPLLAAQDHKALLDGEQGPMTGGMGAYAPTPVMTTSQYDEVLKTIVVPLFYELKRRGAPYTGVLFVGLMMTPAGPKVIEFNARFGDPETQPLMMLWEEGLLDVLLAASGIGSFDDLENRIRFSPGAASCVVMASAGYPVTGTPACPITGLESVPDGCVVFHAGTRRNPQGVWVSAGGRVLGVTAAGSTLKEATDLAYSGVAAIDFKGAQWRRDIGYQALTSTAP